MEKRERTGRWALGKGNAFANPDDYLAFIDGARETIFGVAQHGFKCYGRGLIIFQKKVGGFVESWYVTCQPADFEPFGPAGLQDWQEYDPEHEMLVGVTDREESSLWFWRCAFR